MYITDNLIFDAGVTFFVEFMYSVQCHHMRFGDVAEMLVRGLMKKHEDHVRVLESLVCNQQTLVQLKDAKIEELEDAKHQLHYHLAKLQDHQLFFNVTIFC